MSSARCLALSLLALAGLAAVRADDIQRINLGTIAPLGSSFHQALMAMGEDWRNASGGKLEVVVFPGSSQGTEADVVRLMRVGHLHAGLLTATGLEQIERSIAGLQKLPLVFRNLEEFDHIVTVLRPQLEQRLEAKGFHVLFWADAGWVRWFSTDAAVTPEDFSHHKIFVWADPKQVQVMERLGLHPIAMESSEHGLALKSGRITALPTAPILVLATQLDGNVKHMLRLNYAPLVGAAVITKAAWEKIPAATQAALTAAAEKAGRNLQQRGRDESDKAVVALQKRGLTVHEMTPAAQAAWEKKAQEAYPLIRGSLVPADIYDQVQDALAAYRKTTETP